MNVYFAAPSGDRQLIDLEGFLQRITACSFGLFCFHRAMPKVPLQTLVHYCDKILRTAEIGDYDGAVNGLQVENSGQVTRIAATVDASLATVKLAVAAKADLLIVHHGLFWSKTHPWTGKRRELLRLLIENNLAVYSSHLPLDAHPKLGNNAQLAAALGLKNLRPFFFSHGQNIGLKTSTKISCAELVVRADKLRTSSATTANPRPCSPARAASIDAFRANKLV